MDRAEQLLDERKPEQALELLREFAQQNPADENAAFLLGVAAVAAAEQPATGEEARAALLDEGIAALHGVLVRNPEAVRVRIELAYAFFLKQEDELAAENFERALSSGPPREVASRITHFLGIIRARKRFAGYVSVLIAPDESSPTDGTVNLFGQRVALRDSSLDSSSTGLQIGAGGTYQHPLDEDGRLRLLLGADATRTEHKGGESDATGLQLSAGPRVLLSERTEASLLGVVGRDWAAGSASSREYGAKLSARHLLSPRLELSLAAHWLSNRSYANSNLDGPETGASLRAQYRLTPATAAFASFGLSRAKPEALGSRNRGRSAGLGASSQLPGGWSIGADGTWSRTRYEGSSFSVSGFGSREDRTRTFRVHILNRGFTLLGFSPQLSLVRELRDSNSSIAGYRRKRAELRFVRQF